MVEFQPTCAAGWLGLVEHRLRRSAWEAAETAATDALAQVADGPARPWLLLGLAIAHRGERSPPHLLARLLGRVARPREPATADQAFLQALAAAPELGSLFPGWGVNDTPAASAALFRVHRPGARVPDWLV